MQKSKDFDLSSERFVRLYMQSRTYQELAEKTGLPIRLCYNQAYKLRKRGVKLPKMVTPGRSGLDKQGVDKLNKIVEGKNK